MNLHLRPGGPRPRPAEVSSLGRPTPRGTVPGPCLVRLWPRHGPPTSPSVSPKPQPPLPEHNFHTGFCNISLLPHPHPSRPTLCQRCRPLIFVFALPSVIPVGILPLSKMMVFAMQSLMDPRCMWKLCDSAAERHKINFLRSFFLVANKICCFDF